MDPEQGRLLFGILETAGGLNIRAGATPEQLLPLLLNVVEDLRFQVFQRRLQGDQRVQVVPAGAIKLQ